MKLRTVFMGSPEFAVPSLHVLAQQTQILATICQPDKPAGRGLTLLAPAVKRAAHALGIPVLQPPSIRKERSNFIEELRALQPDLIVVIAYGKILPKEILDLPQMGCWNLHGSVLPYYRGAAPIQWALIQGEQTTGITLMQMDEGMDTGPTFFSKTLPIEPHDTTQSLSQKLSQIASQVLTEGLWLLDQGSLPPAIPQNHAKATMAPLLQKEHGLIDFTRPAHLVAGQIRGTDPWPGAYTNMPEHPETLLKIFGAHVAEGQGRPGEVLGVDKVGLRVACGKGAVSVLELQLPGRKRLGAAAFLAGSPLSVGTILGNGQPNPLLYPLSMKK